jgi:hypothetical protein
MDELLDAIRKLTEAVDRLTEATPKVAYRPAGASVQTGIADADICRMVQRGELGKVPHMGRRVLVPHGELVRRFGTVGRSDGLSVAS